MSEKKISLICDEEQVDFDGGASASGETTNTSPSDTFLQPQNVNKPCDIPSLEDDDIPVQYFVSCTIFCYIINILE